MKNILSLLLCMVLLNNCNYQHESGLTAIQLDNGKPWKANPETVQGISDMKASLLKYEGKLAEETDRKVLQDELENIFQYIFQKCTMTGEGHQQLHNYLLPMRDLIEKIGSENVAGSEQDATQLKKHLDAFQEYFE